MTTETDDGAKGPECSCDADFLRVMGRHGKLCPCERVGKQTPIGVSRYILCSVALDSHNKPNAISIEADAQTVCDHLSANPQLRAAVLTGLVNGGDTQARLVRLTDRVLAEPGVRNIEKVLDLEQQLRLAEFGLAAQLNELRGLYAAFHGSGHSPKNPREAAQAIGQMRDAESELAAERARVAECECLVARWHRDATDIRTHADSHSETRVAETHEELAEELRSALEPRSPQQPATAKEAAK